MEAAASSATMRLKQDLHGPVSVVQHNGNENLLSPSENSTTTTTNTISNTSGYYISSECDNATNNTNNTNQTNQINRNSLGNNAAPLNNFVGPQDFDVEDSTEQRRQDTLQWCNSINSIQYQKNSAQNTLSVNNIPSVALDLNSIGQKNPQLYNNINCTLAASLRTARVAAQDKHRSISTTRPSNRIRSNGRSSVCSESSPDDSLLDYEEAQQSCSSIDTSPQDEDRCFDLSDEESLSDDGNISGEHPVQSRGIVNPNYPGFQHLAHTLDYSIKVCSDTDFTDDDLDLDDTATKINSDANNINNNNNNDDVEYKIDSVNRLDSVENIQKVFYDKPKLNIPLEFDSEKQTNCLNISSGNSNEEASGSNSNDEDFEIEGNIQESETSEVEPEVTASSHMKLNISESISSADIIGDFGKEVEQELGRIAARELEENLEEQVEKLIVEKNDLDHLKIETIVSPSVEVKTVEVLDSLVIQSEVKLHSPLKVVTFETRFQVPKEDDEGIEIIQELQPQLRKEMAEVKVARVCSTDSLTLKINNSFLHPKVEISSTSNIKTTKTADAFLSEAREELPELKADKVVNQDSNSNYPEDEKMEISETTIATAMKTRRDSNRDYEENKEEDTKMEVEENLEKFCKESKTKDDAEKDEDSTVPRKKEKMELNYVKKRRDSSQQIASLITIPRRELGIRSRENLANRRSVPAAREKKKLNPELLGAFDVYNIETAMPKIDLDAIESHLRAAREEERRRRTDREEIRRRLAMGNEEEYYNGNDKPCRKPSLQARLQSGMNLQICFMNETASDTESPSSDSESPVSEFKHASLPPKPYQKLSSQKAMSMQARPISLPLGTTQPLLQPLTQPMTEADFFARQARLQTEARMALAQAKEMAHMQMEVERQRQKKSPITEMIRCSLEKVGIPFPEERRRVSRQILTEMNVAQLQVIVNDLHTQIETLNENLVRFLMNRDDLHMEQDSMLVDIEDLTRYLGAKEQTVKEKTIQNNNTPTPAITAPASPLTALNSVKPRLQHKIANLVKK